ncbi:hypothetical protein BC829DRAFT_386628 [Chytridium lagenaria]|nr:hypothetical protein BC829DRAFT_386628 [Chytridium lagenaria]
MSTLIGSFGTSNAPASNTKRGNQLSPMDLLTDLDSTSKQDHAISDASASQLKAVKSNSKSPSAPTIPSNPMIPPHVLGSVTEESNSRPTTPNLERREAKPKPRPKSVAPTDRQTSMPQVDDSIPIPKRNPLDLHDWQHSDVKAVTSAASQPAAPSTSVTKSHHPAAIETRKERSASINVSVSGAKIIAHRVDSSTASKPLSETPQMKESPSTFSSSPQQRANSPSPLTQVDSLDRNSESIHRQHSIPMSFPSILFLPSSFPSQSRVIAVNQHICYGSHDDCYPSHTASSFIVIKFLGTSSKPSTPVTIALKGAPVPLAVKMMKSRKASSSHDDISSATSAAASRTLANSNSGSATSLTPGAKDRKRFNKIFPEVAEIESLLSVYTCALEREVLIQGKIFLTSNYISFYANILGNLTTIVIPFTEVVTVEKKSTAGMFPNAIRIATSDHKYVFSSFLKRDSAFMDIVELWKLSANAFPADPVDGTSPNAPLDDNIMTADEFLRKSSIVPGSPTTPTTPVAEFWISPTKSASSASSTAQSTPTSGTCEQPSSALESFLHPHDNLPKKRGRALTQGACPSFELKTPSRGRKELASHETSENESTPVATRTNRSATVGLFKKIIHQNTGPAAGAAPTSNGSSNEGIHPTLPPLTTSRLNTSSGALSAPVDGSHSFDPTPPQSPSIDIPVKCGFFGMDFEELCVALFGATEQGGSGRWLDAHRKKDSVNLRVEKWSEGLGIGSEREVTCNVMVKMPMIQKPTPTYCFERQIVIASDKKSLTVETMTKTPKLPYGESFQTVIRYCLTHEGSSNSRLVISAKVEFMKKIIMKERIEQNCLESLHTFCSHLTQSLHLHRPQITRTINLLPQTIPRPTPTDALRQKSRTRHSRSNTSDSDSNSDVRPLLRRTETVSRKSRLNPANDEVVVTTWVVLWEALIWVAVAWPVKTGLWTLNGVSRWVGRPVDVAVPAWIANIKLPRSVTGWMSAAGARTDSMSSGAAAGGGGAGVGGGGGGSPTRQRSKSERRRSRHRNSTNTDMNWKDGANAGGNGGGGDGSRLSGIPPNVWSMLVMALVLLAVCAGVVVTALNGGKGCGGEGLKGPLSAEEKEELESELAEAQSRFVDRSFASLTASRQAIADAGRSNDLIRAHLDRIRRNMGTTLADIAGAPIDTEKGKVVDDSEAVKAEDDVVKEKQEMEVMDPLKKLSEPERRIVVETIVEKLLAVDGDDSIASGTKVVGEVHSPAEAFLEAPDTNSAAGQQIEG